jgi:Leucine-rich repeat (LRR) protein
MQYTHTHTHTHTKHTQKTIEEAIKQCEVAKNPTLFIEVETNYPIQTQIPHSISTLTHIHTLNLLNYEFMSYKTKINVDGLKLIKNRIETCLIWGIDIKPELNEKTHPLYTLTNLKYLEMFNCKISQFDENISKLRSLQTLLLDQTSGLCTVPSSILKLTSLVHLSLQNTKIRSDTLASIVFNHPSLEELELNEAYELATISQISQLTSLRYLSLSQSGNIPLPTEIGLLTRLHTLKLSFVDELSSMCFCFCFYLC